MSVEELLRPRYNVIADYPGSHFNVGNILYHDTKQENRYWYSLTEKNERFYVSDIELYPHLFRKLEWWEDRKEDDLPEYLKFYDGSVIKVVEWKINTLGVLYSHIEWIEQGEKVINDNQCYKSAQPATEEDYLQQNTLVK